MVAATAVAIPTAAAGGTGRQPSNRPGAQVDTGTLSAIAGITGARAMWDAGFTGAGIGVAVIDTGVARVPGLDRPDKVVDGPDLSFDSQIPDLQNTDAFGHGTHIAGIIAGSDVDGQEPAVGCATCTGLTTYSDTTKFEGIAPDARIINLKVGAFDGSVDVTQIIAAINWAVQHKDDKGLNIRVLNLSFGTDSVQPADVDPLAYAVDQAWNAGIVVVTAAGNDGQAVGPLADPAISPNVIAVGSTDPMGTLPTDDDTVPDFAQHGTAQRGVDIAVPGVSVQSLRVPGGFVDSNITTGKDGDRFQRASGTSQSTAVVSGLSALILSKIPGASPSTVKAMLTGNAKKPKDKKSTKVEYIGSGVTDLTWFALQPESLLKNLFENVLPKPTTSTGSGSLEASRGSYHVGSANTPLTGERDIFGQSWDAPKMAKQSHDRKSWNGGTWNNTQWTGNPSNGKKWTQTAWTAADWTGTPWSTTESGDAPWTGARWSGARWSGARWSDADWKGARWSGARWSGARWSGARWSGARWSDAAWE